MVIVSPSLSTILLITMYPLHLTALEKLFALSERGSDSSLCTYIFQHPYFRALGFRLARISLPLSSELLSLQPLFEFPSAFAPSITCFPRPRVLVTLLPHQQLFRKFPWTQALQITCWIVGVSVSRSPPSYVVGSQRHAEFSSLLPSKCS